MDNEKMARFIVELRKEKKLTQKDLANQLGITDKAVSKWERGISCPDIALLSPLSDILGVTTTELLRGEKNEEAPEVETAVEETLHFADKAVKSRSRKIRSILFLTVSVLFFLGAAVCVICDLAITGRFTWSMIPVTSLLLAWLVITPGIVWKKRGLAASLVSLSIAVIPYLFLLEKYIGIGGLIMPLGVKISVIGIAGLWCIYLLAFQTKRNRFTAAAGSFLVMIPVSWGINMVVDVTVQGKWRLDLWDILVSVSLLIAAAFYITGYMREDF